MHRKFVRFYVFIAFWFSFAGFAYASSSAPAAPTFSTGAGTYYAPLSVTIADATSCASIYYTLNGATPTTASTLYTGPIAISSATTLKAIAVCSGGSPSSVASATYNIVTPAQPGFNPGATTYYAPISVTMVDGTSCASIYYTLNGATPTTASSLYTGPITISSTATLSAIAVCPGGSPSVVTSGTFTVSSPAKPIFATAAGAYTAPLSVAIAESTPCASIYYTTNGATPTSASTLYTGPIAISSTATVKAIAVCSGGLPSAVSSNTYTIAIPAQPTLSAATGTYYAPLSVTIAAPASCTSIHFTTNGATPTTASALYTGPIAISSTATLSAIAVCSGSPSPVVSATYTITTPAKPVLSAASGGYFAPLSVTIADAASCASIFYTLNGTTPTTASTLYTGPIAISSATTLKAIAVCSGGSLSAVASATYNIVTPAQPGFNPGATTYYAPISVTMVDGTSCASIYYTLNGATPTIASSLYTGPITISSTATLSAIAVCPGGSPSVVTSGTFTVSSPAKPIFATAAGAYTAPVSVAISESTPCALIHYTTNGVAPTTASAVYSSPIPINSTTTLSAVAICPGGSPSSVTSATFTLENPAAPVIGTASGTYESSVSVSLSEATPGAVIYYTTNGATPSAASAVYSAPIQLSNSTTFSTTVPLNVVAASPGGLMSPVVSAAYTILSGVTPFNSANTSTSFFGMDVNHLGDGTPWPLVPVGTLRLWDSGTMWSNLNTAQGVYNWTPLDAQIAMAQANGAEVLYALGGTPPWAIPTNMSIASVSRNNSVVTVETAAPHGLYYNPIYAVTAQTSVTLAGVVDSSFDGTFVLTGTPTSTTLTFAQAGPNAQSSEGTVSAVCGGTYAPGGCAEPPANLADWDAYITALIDHVGPGVIQYWELWNEANLDLTWRGNPTLLVSMAADARKIIKNVDPNAIILSPSTTIALQLPSQCLTWDPRCASNWLNNWLAAGGAATIDGVAFHGYPQVNLQPEQILGAASLLQSVMNTNGVGALPLLDTESSEGLASQMPVVDDQIAFLARHLLLEQSIGVQRSTWYAYDNANWGPLWCAAQGLSSVGAAYQLVAQWTTGAQLTQACATTASNATTYTCSYSRANGYQAMAVWNTSGSATFTVPSGYVQSRDLFGDVEPVNAGTMTIGASPILLETGTDQ